MLSERRKACIYGGALGDALGYKVEFMSTTRIRDEWGDQGITLAKCDGVLEVSDDTQMTLFTIEAISDVQFNDYKNNIGSGGQNYRLISRLRLAYLDWLETQDKAHKDIVGLLAHEPLLRKQQVPGFTCLEALRKGARGTVAKPVNSSKGCGGVMRVAPLGVWLEGGTDRWHFKLGCDAAAITHGHPDGYLPGGAMVLLIKLILNDFEWNDAIERVLKQFPITDGDESHTAVLLKNVLQLVASKKAHTDCMSELGEGWTGDEALAIGLYAAMVSDTFEGCIELAANHDGDSDSTASIAGQLYGAKHGMKVIPADAIERLDVIKPLRDVMRRCF